MRKISFSERVLRAYAAVMKKLFPTWCVKHKTLKLKHYSGTWGTTHNYAGELFLPGKEAELKAIEKLGFDAEALNKRYWSMETKIELLEQGNFAMLSRIKTEDELRTIIRTGKIEKIIEAMGYYTPSRKYLLDFIRSMPDHQLFLIIKAVPSAFDSLQAWEVLGVDEKAPYEGKDNWIIARNFIEAKPSVWLPRFLKELRKIEPSELNHEAMLTVADCVIVAKDSKVDISDSIVYLMTFHAKSYAVLRYEIAQNYGKKEINPYVKVLLPSLLGKIASKGFMDFFKGYTDEVPEEWAKMMKPLSEEREAAVWLYLALKHGCETSVIIDNLATLREKLIGKAWLYLVKQVIANAEGISDIEKLIKFFNNDEKIQEKLRDNLLEVATSSSEVLKGYFPFDGWKKEQAEEAVRLMARGKTLPDDISSLSEELQSVAMDELEIQSEIEVLRGGSCGDKEALILQRLHPRTEVYLLTCEYEKLVSYGLTYVQNFCMDDSTFKTVVNTNEDSACGKIENSLKKVITLHAEKWGLNQRNYKDLMQSPYYSNMAAFLKKYVQKEGK